MVGNVSMISEHHPSLLSLSIHVKLALNSSHKHLLTPNKKSEKWLCLDASNEHYIVFFCVFEWKIATRWLVDILLFQDVDEFVSSSFIIFFCPDENKNFSFTICPIWQHMLDFWVTGVRGRSYRMCFYFLKTRISHKSTQRQSHIVDYWKRKLFFLLCGIRCEQWNGGKKLEG